MQLRDGQETSLISAQVSKSRTICRYTICRYCGVSRVGHGPPESLVVWATVQFVPPAIAPYLIFLAVSLLEYH